MGKDALSSFSLNLEGTTSNLRPWKRGEQGLEGRQDPEHHVPLLQDVWPFPRARKKPGTDQCSPTTDQCHFWAARGGAGAGWGPADLAGRHRYTGQPQRGQQVNLVGTLGSEAVWGQRAPRASLGPALHPPTHGEQTAVHPACTKFHRRLTVVP